MGRRKKIKNEPKKKSQSKKILIDFNRRLYVLKAIKTAAKAYGHLADFDFKQTGKYIQAELTNIDKETEHIIKDEFCNYVLFIMQK